MADLGALDNLKKINGQAPQEAAAGVAVTTGTAAIAIDSAQIRDHVKAINALSTKLAHAEAKVEQYQVAIGQHIKAIKQTRPDAWKSIVRTECNLSRSRAYELLAIADGTKTVEQVRTAGAKRVREYEERKKISHPLANGQPANNADDPEASAAEMRAKFAAIETVAPSKTTSQHEPEATQIETAEPEVAREHDRGLVEQLHVAKIKIVDLESEIRHLKDANAELRIENDALREKIAGRLTTKPGTTGYKRWSQKKAAEMILQMQRWNYANPNDLCDPRTLDRIRNFHRLRPKLTELFLA